MSTKCHQFYDDILMINVFIILTFLPSIHFQKICNIEIYLVSNYKFQIKLPFRWGRLEWPGESSLHSYTSKIIVNEEQIHYTLLDIIQHLSIPSRIRGYQKHVKPVWWLHGLFTILLYQGFTFDML